MEPRAGGERERAVPVHGLEARRGYVEPGVVVTTLRQERYGLNR